MEDARDWVDLTHGLRSPGTMPPNAGPLGSATLPSPLPIPQIAGTSRSATAPTGSIRVLMVDDNRNEETVHVIA